MKMEKPKYEIAVQNAETNFLQVLDKPNVFLKEAAFAMQAIKESQQLVKISNTEAGAESIKNAVINIALTGLSLHPSFAHAYLVPRGGKCCLDISYKGLIKIVSEDNSNISSVSAMVVYDWDKFEYEEGSTPFVKHIPNLMPEVDTEVIRKDPKKIWDHVVGAYSRAIMRDGSVSMAVLPKWRLWKIYQTSKSKDSIYSPWTTWPEEQIRKTVIKYHSKTLQGTGTERLQNAVAILNEHEGPDFKKPIGPSNAEKLNEALDENKEKDISNNKDDSTVDAEFTESDKEQSSENDKKNNNEIDEIEKFKKNNPVFKAIYCSMKLAKKSSDIKNFTDDVMRQKSDRLSDPEQQILRDLADQKLKEFKK